MLFEHLIVDNNLTPYKNTSLITTDLSQREKLIKNNIISALCARAHTHGVGQQNCCLKNIISLSKYDVSVHNKIRAKKELKYQK